MLLVLLDSQQHRHLVHIRTWSRRVCIDVVLLSHLSVECEVQDA